MTKARSNATAPNAKGTLVVGNGTDASTTLAVASTAGYVLTVDSAEATGLKWAAPASSSGPAFRAYRSGSNFVPAEDTWTKIEFQTESFDTDSKYNTSTYEFTPTQEGYYYFTIHTSLNTNAVVRLAIYKNGSAVQNSLFNPGNEMIMTTDFLYSDNNDYFSAYIYMDSSTARTVDYGEGASFWAAHFVRS